MSCICERLDAHDMVEELGALAQTFMQLIQSIISSKLASFCCITLPGVHVLKTKSDFVFFLFI